MTTPTPAEFSDLVKAIRGTGLFADQAERVAAAVFTAGFRDPDEVAPSIKAEALREAADLADKGEGGGADAGECKDWADWLRARAATTEGKES